MMVAGLLYQGLLYRALNPVFAREPLSGHGAALYGGRFNPKGVPALYCALSPTTALREANQVGMLQPTTLVAYRADIADVLDGQDVEALARFDMDPAALAASTWRDEMKSAGIARSQRFAQAAIEAGYSGLMVRSFAPGLGDDDLNLVLWRWGNAPATQVVVIDDENRLSR